MNRGIGDEERRRMRDTSLWSSRKTVRVVVIWEMVRSAGVDIFESWSCQRFREARCNFFGLFRCPSFLHMYWLFQCSNFSFCKCLYFFFFSTFMGRLACLLASSLAFLLTVVFLSFFLACFPFLLACLLACSFSGSRLEHQIQRKKSEKKKTQRITKKQKNTDGKHVRTISLVVCRFTASGNHAGHT